jgi:hypothetical protein
VSGARTVKGEHVRQLDLNEARAAVELLRLSLKFTRTVLSAWDHQGKDAREKLIRFLDDVEKDIEEGLTLPPGEAERWFKFNYETYSKMLAELETKIAANS